MQVARQSRFHRILDSRHVTPDGELIKGHRGTGFAGPPVPPPGGGDAAGGAGVLQIIGPKIQTIRTSHQTAPAQPTQRAGSHTSNGKAASSSPV